MGQISLTLPSDGTTIEAADVNNPFNTILNEFNGNIDDNNIKSGANINGTKLLANSLPPTVFDTNSRAGWLTSILPAPNTITALGNRSYQLVFNTTDLTGYISAGMRLRTTRTTAAPNQCTSLNGSTQFYSKSSPAGMTFTDDPTFSAWIKLTSYAAGSIISRYNGTSGFDFGVDSSGRLYAVGFNAGAANFSQILSYASIPLNKWVHVAAELDMSAFTNTSTTSYTMIDGVDVPGLVSRGGTNPTALVQAGNLEIGSRNAGTQPFPGKIAQVAIYNAHVTQATILASMHQTLAGTETALISAYSFNNTINDLNTTNANNLTANGSAVATNADSPFGGQADGTISTTLDYGIVTAASFSTNTTLTVQVPEGCTIPTSGGVNTVDYSVHKAPYGMPNWVDKWTVNAILKTTTTTTTSSSFNNNGNLALTIPTGDWQVSYNGSLEHQKSSSTSSTSSTTLSSSSSSETNPEFTSFNLIGGASGTLILWYQIYIRKPLSLAAVTKYYLNQSTDSSSSVQWRGDKAQTTIEAELALL